MTSITLSVSDLQVLKSHPRFTPSHAALLDIMIEQGEVIVEAPAAPAAATPPGVQA